MFLVVLSGSARPGRLADAPDAGSGPNDACGRCDLGLRVDTGWEGACNEPLRMRKSSRKLDRVFREARAMSRFPIRVCIVDTPCNAAASKFSGIAVESPSSAKESESAVCERFFLSIAAARRRAATTVRAEGFMLLVLDVARLRLQWK